MTNEAISAILEYLCNEARNSVHATFGLMELLHEVATDSTRPLSMAVRGASADRLLRSIDDVRELLSSVPPAPATMEEFDLALCAGEIIEVLNLASEKRGCHMFVDAPPGPLRVTQDRKAVEQMLTRILGTASKLAQARGVGVKLSLGDAQNGCRAAISAGDAGLTARLTSWLNVEPDGAVFEDADEVPFALAVMVAGKLLRGMGGSAELARDSAGPAVVALDLPSQTMGVDSEDLAAFRKAAPPGALNVLVAEDCDDSFVLSELMLRNEHVWRARDGQEALRAMQKQRFDVVFMDVHMPGMDGYTVIRSMREWETQTGNARTPMVVLSSDDLETQRLSAAQCGCSGFLRKPLRRGDLTNLLDRLKQARMPLA
jgi:CheY-like chemotaxis protein